MKRVGVAVRVAAEREQPRRIDADLVAHRARALPHLGVREHVVAGGHRGVRGEHRVIAHAIHGRVEIRAVAAEFAHAFDHHERRVTLVGVPGVGVDADGAQHAHAAHAEHPFLAQAVVAATGVERVREFAVGGIVALEVGVEQEQRHPAHVHAPRAHLHRAAGDLEGGQIAAAPGVEHACERRDGRVERFGGALLPSVGAHDLVEIALV